jgi:dienelactone hydrolase
MAFLPDPAIATGTAAIVCPGGSFHFLAIEHEGTEVARRLYPLLAADGARAVGVVRQCASEWGFKSDRVGIIGFSAGRTVAVATALRHVPLTRPDFVAAIYPAPGGPVLVPTDAPSLFLALANDDDLAVGASVPLYSAWRAAECPVELHVFSQGGHGFGLRKQGLASDRWSDLFEDWLRSRGLLQPPGPTTS